MSPGKIPVPTTELLGTFLEALGYGVYLVVFPQCLRIMLRRNLSSVITAVFVASIVINFLLITLHIVVDLTRAFTAFTANLSVGGAAEAYYANVNTHLNITKNAAYCSATLLADALLVYRTFIVWGRNYLVVILPVLLFILDFAMSVWFTWSVNEAHPGSSVLVSTVFARSKYFFVATLALNLLCTVLIAYKIWKVQSQVVPYVSGPSRGANALSIILESAAIYSAALICLIGTSIAGSSVMFLWLNSGSVFSYIILRSSTDIKRFNTTLSIGTNAMMFATQATDKTGATARTQGYKHQSAYLGPRPGLQSDVEGVHVRLQQMVHRDDTDMDSAKVSDSKIDASISGSEA
ncbi:hypothetical protein JR316_0001810 [Psilocybe cubensis]|uniref:Uncharacterized protein n=1 Tax=Psilocybe cubensis TaxID=181762 RepID=A0ACB8HA70_PSICU|nr:hypothetical protein JR316_0001810 [Psilocybe cubensis]KAH9484908.1 hypothetical protein JR316_0001810 [Psilocybe cubensis]